MLRAIAIDDEPGALKVIEVLAGKVPALTIEHTFRSALDALKYLQSHRNIDLIFLDINMPDLGGIEFLETLKNPPMIIFTTAYAEYALQSYDYEAVGYLVKPIHFSKFVKAVQRAGELKALQTRTPEEESNDDAFILIKSGPKTHQVAHNDIWFIEAAGNYTCFVLPDKKVLSDHPLSVLEEQLPPHLFRRIHRSYIINVHCIEVIEKHQVKIKGHLLPVGKTYRTEFLKQFKP